MGKQKIVIPCVLANVIGKMNVTSHVIPSEGDRSDHRFRCISNRLGCNLSRPTDWGPMVRERVQHAHKLPAIAGSHHGSAIIHQELNKVVSVINDRQHNSSSIHQQPWRDSVQGPNSPDQEHVDMVLGKKYQHHSTVPTKNRM